MLKFSIASGIRKKLTEKHGISELEIEQCFLNRRMPVLIDDLEDHATDPPSLFFVSHTDKGRRLLVVYIQKGPKVVIKTAFEPSDARVSVYERLVKGVQK